MQGPVGKERTEMIQSALSYDFKYLVAFNNIAKKDIVQKGKNNLSFLDLLSFRD